MEKIILLDTSFLIACAQFRIDYLSEFERILPFVCAPAIVDKAFAELEHLAEKGTLQKKQVAKLALTVLLRKGIQVVKTEKAGTADDAILLFANKGTIVATIDAELKRRLKNKGVSFVVIRQKKYLQLIG